MKNATLFLGLVLLLVFPTSCSEDAVLESLTSASRTDNNIVLEQPPGFGDLKLDLTKPGLKIRIGEIRDSLEQFLAPEVLMLVEEGRKILRDRGVDPDTAFSEGPNDLRLAMIPSAAQVLDEINKLYQKRGYTIVDVVERRTPTGRDTQGPWGDLSDDNVSWFSAPEEDLHDCVAEAMGDVGQMFAVAYGGAKVVGVAGKALISFVGGPVVITVGGALTVGAIAYGGYRIQKCLNQKAEDRRNGVTCSITMSLEDYCKNMIKAETERGELSDQGQSCKRYLIDLLMSKMTALELRMTADTLSLVVDPNFNPDPKITDMLKSKY